MSGGYPELGEWHDTRRALHAWCRLLSAVRGALEKPHPRWWHISLKVTARGLSTGPLGEDGPAAALDLRRHRLTLDAGDRRHDGPPLAAAPPVEQAAGWLLERLQSEHGLAPDISEGRWRDGSVGRYQPAAAERYLQAAIAAAAELERTRGALAGERGPVQLWAHHFDIAFELFGERSIEHEGEPQPAQIGFGFFPGDDDDPRAYFYGTPWPFADELLERPLPAPARWQTEPWEGARLPYSAAEEDGAVVADFLRAVHAGSRSVLAG